MSFHIEAKAGEIADTILLPGDPLRAKHIAETMLEDPVCYNQVRAEYGYTGTYQGKRVSVQGTGMGMPSISIYVHELITEYNVKTLIRVGSCGALQPDVEPGDILLALSASTNSQMNRLRFGGMDYAPTASFRLVKRAYDVASEMGVDVKVGSIFSSDTFYVDDPDYWKIWIDHGMLAAEMETTALYTLAARFKVEAVTILAVTDSILTHEVVPPEDKVAMVNRMTEIALRLVGN
jgi:purine-nucleoside phosphorylase